MNINMVKIQLYSRRYLSDVFFSSFKMICCEVLVRSMKDSWQKFEGNYSSTSSSLVDKVTGLFIQKWLDQPLWEEWSSKLALLINLCTVQFIALIFSWNNLIPFENWNERSITIWYIQYTDIWYNGKFVGNDVINAFHIHFQIWWMKRKDFVTM